MSDILPISIQVTQSLTDRRVAFVGKLGSMNRREARELVRQQEAIVLDGIDQTVDLIVIGADELPLGDTDDLLDDWVLQAADEGRLEIISETELWQHLGLFDPEVNVDQLYTPAMLAELLELPIATIRRWHRRGLITPARQVNKLAYFDFQEVASARRIARLIASGASPQAVESKLSRLAQLYPDLQRPLSQLSVIVEGKDLLLRQGEGLIEPGGQMRINFDLSGDDDVVAREGNLRENIGVIPMDTATPESDVQEFTTPDEFVELAIWHEDAGEPDSAIEVYRAMSLAFGPSADVSFRLAELLYQQHNLSAACERYYMTIELDETFVEARASLGCVLVEMGELELAHSAFQGALQHHANYPDVHFHLARLLDLMDQPLVAEAHWRQFLELAPKSPWSDEARERLQES